MADALCFTVSNLQMECGGDNRQSSKLVGEGHAWGDWLAYSSCASGHYICGIHTLVEKYQGNADDTALNAVRFLCCKRPTNPQWYVANMYHYYKL